MSRKRTLSKVYGFGYGPNAKNRKANEVYLLHARDVVRHPGASPPLRWFTKGELLDAENKSACHYVFDRRIDLVSVPPDASLYSLLRAWVQDDPSRPAQMPIPSVSSRLEPPASLPDPDRIALLMDALRPARKSTEKEDILNSLPFVPPQMLLETHLVTMKIVRKTWQRFYAFKYLQYRDKLDARGVGRCRLHEKILQQCSGETKQGENPKFEVSDDGDAENSEGS